MHVCVGLSLALTLHSYIRSQCIPCGGGERRLFDLKFGVRENSVVILKDLLTFVRIISSFSFFFPSTDKDNVLLFSTHSPLRPRLTPSDEILYGDIHLVFHVIVYHANTPFSTLHYNPRLA